MEEVMPNAAEEINTAVHNVPYEFVIFVGGRWYDNFVRC